MANHLAAVPRDPVENAAIALAQHRVNFLGIGQAWLNVHEDVREAYRDEVRLVLRAARESVAAFDEVQSQQENDR